MGFETLKSSQLWHCYCQEVFHEEIKKTISTVDGAKNIVDDIIVYDKTPKLHDEALRNTLQRLKSN